MTYFSHEKLLKIKLFIYKHLTLIVINIEYDYSDNYFRYLTKVLTQRLPSSDTHILQLIKTRYIKDIYVYI